MLATIDIGNTSISVGLFQGQSPRATCTFTLAADVHRPADEYVVLLDGLLRQAGIQPGQVRGVAIASVVPPLTETFAHLCARFFKVPPLVVGAGTRTGIRIATANPREVGTDRVVNAVAAFHLVNGPAIVVDFGTPTTFDVIGPDGAYLGAVIAPGLLLSAEALYHRTARLPRVDLVRPPRVVGKDTMSALQSGLLYGHVAMVEGMIQRIRAEIGMQSTTIATGELATLVAREMSAIQHVEPHLSLLGLRLIYEHNRGATTAPPADARPHPHPLTPSNSASPAAAPGVGRG